MCCSRDVRCFGQYCRQPGQCDESDGVLFKSFNLLYVIASFCDIFSFIIWPNVIIPKRGLETREGVRGRGEEGG